MIIQKFKISFYGIILVLSIIIGMLYIFINLKKNNIDKKDIGLYFIMYISFAFVFGKIYTVFAYNKSSFLTAGLSSYGGLIGVVLGAIIFEKIKDCNGQVIKYTILSLPLVYSLSKIACSLAGCCGGIPYNGIFKIMYENTLNIWQFPIQIVEVIVSLIIFIICNKLKNKNNINYITMLLVAIAKYSLDFLRYDHLNITITKNQYFSIVLLVITIAVYIYKHIKTNPLKFKY